MELGGQVALVTGASRGIGRGIALALAEAGAQVALAARSLERLSSVEREIRDRGGRHAGIGLFGALSDFSAEDFDRLVAVNLKAVFLCCRQAMRLMVPRRAGYIINISSVVGFKGYPNQSIYTATKHGVMGITKSLAVEAQPHGIRVSAVLPGGTDTEMRAKGRPDLDRSQLLQPEDIARVVLFLLSLSPRAAIDQIYIRRRDSAPF